MRQEGFEPSTGWVEATCSVQAELLARDRLPRVWRFDSIERQRSALRGLGWSSPAFFKKHAPSLSTLACHLRLVVVAGADPGIDDFSLGTPAAHHIVNRAQAAWAPSS